jgi:tetratricopeptide (TPR) repeat protein
MARQMNLAVLVGSRPRGDPAENFEASIEILRDALGQLGDSPSDLCATVQMNLAHHLHIRERGDRKENLQEARDLCLASLEWRSLDRNSEDWAYSKINLGGIYDDLAQIGEADLRDATATLEEVIAAEQEIEAKWLVGVAHSSLGALYRGAAERQAEADARAVIGPGEPPPPGPVERKHLDAAKRNLEAALRLLGAKGHSDYRGRTLCDLGEVYEATADYEAAVEHYRAALELLRPSVMVHHCRQAGSGLGNLMAKRGLWSDSAEAFSIATSAMEFGFHSRLETADRQMEAQRAGNLARWTAFALAKTGDYDAAVLVLESGRTRELRRRIGLWAEEARLSDLPAETRIDYREALEELSATSLGPGSDEAGRQLQAVLTGIRELPGFQDFATGARWPEICAAVDHQRPIVYINPSPWGTVMLPVSDPSGEPHATARFVDVTSHDVLMAMMFGDMQDSVPTSYLAGPGEDDEGSARICRGLEYVIKALGQSIAEPLVECIRDLGATQATLIPCGPLAQAPLHALALERDTEET